MRARVRLDGPSSGATRFAAERLVCGALGVELALARSVLDRLPATLPIAQPEPEARDLARKLTDAGVPSSAIAVPKGNDNVCVYHSRFLESARCSECSRPLCLICERQGEGDCFDCVQRAKRRKRNQRLRIAVLLTILFGVCSLGVKEWRRRHLGWERPHRVLVVLVNGPGKALASGLSSAFAARAEAVERTLELQRRRYSPNSLAPIELTVVGPVAEASPPPALDDADLWSLLQFNLELRSYAEQHDDRSGVDGSPFDVRLYVRASQSTGRSEAAEGLGQQHGSIGVVSTEISVDGVDFAWFVAIHEYLHTRGATDKYGPDGRAVSPQGYANPEQEPLLPQHGTELMARGRPQSLTMEDIPGAPESWVIGKWTAAEIGWTPAQ